MSIVLEPQKEMEPKTVFHRSAPTTSPGGRLLYLDVLRGVAILLVLGYHQAVEARPQDWGFALLSRWGLMGWTGVDLFFVLSGFLIGGLLLNEYQQRQQISIGRFYIRRGFKIWPSYLLFICTITLFLLAFHRHSEQLHTDGAGDVGRLVWPYFLHIQNYVAPLRKLIVHTWSLSVEEHFYLVLPLALLAMTSLAKTKGPAALRAIPLVALALGVICAAWRTANYLLLPDFGLEHYYFPTHLRIDSLMAGVLLAYLVRFRPQVLEPLRRHRIAVLVVSLLCYLPTVLWERDSIAYLRTVGLSVLAVGSMGLVLLAWFADQDRTARNARDASKSGGGRKDAPALARLLAWIGFYSYSIYLWSLPFPNLVLRKLVERAGVVEAAWIPLAVIGGYVVVAIATGMIMYRIVEGPALALRDRLFPSHAGIGAAKVTSVS